LPPSSVFKPSEVIDISSSLIPRFSGFKQSKNCLVPECGGSSLLRMWLSTSIYLSTWGHVPAKYKYLPFYVGSYPG
jgi:hypothetical protein